MMTDEEVGELWKWVESSEPDDAGIPMYVQAHIENLIIKLVGDRTVHYCGGDDQSLALRDFGIDPESW